MTTAVAPPVDVDALYRATTTPQFVRVPMLRFICLDGRGDPATNPEYSDAIQALYSVAYTAKYAVKAAGGAPVKLSPLEGLWWADDPAVFATEQRSEWNWTMMLRIPPQLTSEIVTQSRDDVVTRRAMPSAQHLRVMEFEEGTAAQVLHIGPYDAEGPTITRLHDFITSHGFAFRGSALRHHEIYLGDPRRCPAERLRTIIRQPYTTCEPPAT